MENRAESNPAGMIGASISILAYLIMATQLPKDGVITGIVWCIAVLVFYYGWSNTKAGSQALKQGQIAKANESLPPLPTVSEKQLLDREFRVWRNIVAVAFVAAIALYLIPFII